MCPEFLVNNKFWTLIFKFHSNFDKKHTIMKIFYPILIIIICSLFIGCSDNENGLEYNLPYFQFKNEDASNLLNLPELNSRLTFINQSNKKLYFDVVKSESRIHLYFKGNWVYGSTKYFYHDVQEILLRSTLFDIDNFQRYIEINIETFPTEFNPNVFPVIISKESRLSAYIQHSVFNNTGPNSFFEDFKNFTRLIIGTKVYKKVKKLDISTTALYNINWPLPALDYIYFDVNEGLIGFDDRNGNEWRLKS
jgi:hypothetical protein